MLETNFLHGKIKFSSFQPGLSVSYAAVLNSGFWSSSFVLYFSMYFKGKLNGFPLQTTNWEEQNLNTCTCVCVVVITILRYLSDRLFSRPDWSDTAENHRESSVKLQKLKGSHCEVKHWNFANLFSDLKRAWSERLLLNWANISKEIIYIGPPY